MPVPKYYEYYVRMYIDGITALNRVKNRECLNKIKQSIYEHQKVLDYAKNCTSKNLKYLSLAKRFLGINIAEKLILKRYL